jgi:hypothetical protein
MFWCDKRMSKWVLDRIFLDMYSCIYVYRIIRDTGRLPDAGISTIVTRLTAQSAEVGFMVLTLIGQDNVGRCRWREVSGYMSYVGGGSNSSSNSDTGASNAALGRISWR